MVDIDINDGPMDMFFFPRWHLKIDTIQPSKPLGPKMVCESSNRQCLRPDDVAVMLTKGPGFIIWMLGSNAAVWEKHGTKEKTMSKLPWRGMIENGDMCHLLCGWCFLFCAYY